MLIILISWTCIILLAYPIGAMLHLMLSRMLKLEPADMHFSLLCTSGLLILSFISTVLCLFVPLAFGSNLLLLAVCLACILAGRKKLRRLVGNDLTRLRKSHWTVILICFSLTIVVSYLSYLPSSHNDDGLYYSTTIKWLEEYGTVKGLANVSSRVGFNSSWHVLQANLGFRYLGAGLFNDLNGLLYVLMLFYAAGGINNLIKGDNSIANSIRALVMLPVIFLHFGATSNVIPFNVNYLSSATPDIPACLISWLIFVLFIQKPAFRGAELRDVLIVLYAAWVISIKLSALPVILPGIFILGTLILTRNFKSAIQIMLLAGLIMLPWLVRNVLLSGYLLFPFSGIDIFNVPWKVPLSVVRESETIVRLYAIGADLGKPFTMTFPEWLPSWFGRAKPVQQFSLALSLLATVSFITIFLWHVFRRNNLFLKTFQRDIVCLLTCTCGLLFWLMKAPDFRFGYVFIWFYCMYFVTIIFQHFLKTRLHYLFFPVIIFMASAVIFHYQDRWMSARLLFGKPLAYRMPQHIKRIALSGRVHMNVVSGGDIWNAPLPAADENEFTYLQPYLLGTSIREGFRSTKDN